MRKVRIPGPNVPEVDNTGRPTTAWYAWKSNVDQILGTDQDALAESVTKDVFDSSAHAPATMGLRQRVEKLEHAAEFDQSAVIAALRKDVNRLQTIVTELLMSDNSGKIASIISRIKSLESESAF